MRIERVLFIGIIVAIFSVGFASAETIWLTQSNVGYDGFNVTVTTNNNLMRVNVTDLPAGHTVKGIDMVYYNLPHQIINVSVDGAGFLGLGTWQLKGSGNTAGFGIFDQWVKQPGGTGTDIIFKLSDMGDIPPNENGHRIAVHLRFDDDDEFEGITVSENDGSSTFLTDIPEFPTVALPIAAILGLMFIFGRKKDL